MPLPRWVTPVLAATTVGLVPWTLWLTFSLPGRRVSVHYDLAWVGFDVGLFVAFAATGWSIVRSSKWLVPLAAATGAMLLCDVWFDVVTAGPNDIGEAVAEALLAEIPLAGLCARVRARARQRDALALDGVAFALEQAQPVLELSDAQLDLVELVARHEIQILDERAHRRERLLREPGPAAADARRQLEDELLDRVDDPLATARGHAVSNAAAGVSSRAAPARPARRVTR